jgi:hypothetical protein
VIFTSYISPVMVSILLVGCKKPPGGESGGF